jgi:hypothetical protein
MTRKGYKQTLEHRAKIGNASRGVKHKKPMSAEHRAKIAMARTKSIEEITGSVIIDPIQGCWMARGVSGNTYTKLYRKVVGPVTEGLVLDHLCGNGFHSVGAARERVSERVCIRPDHLDPCTRSENVRRGAYPHFHLRGKCWKDTNLW